MCPSYMATRDETDTTRGRANVLRLATNKLKELEAGTEDVATSGDGVDERRAHVREALRHGTADRKSVV